MGIIASRGLFDIKSGGDVLSFQPIGVVLSGEIVAKDTTALQISKVRKRAR